MPNYWEEMCVLLEKLGFWLHWINLGVWLAISFVLFQKIKRSRTSRALEWLFGGISLVVALHMLSVKGDIWFLAFFGHPLVEVALYVTLTLLGIWLLRTLPLWFDRWMQAVARSGLEERYRYMIERDPRAILMFDHECLLVEINRQGYAILAEAGEELEGRKLIDLMRRIQPFATEAWMEAILQKEQLEVKWQSRILGEFEWNELVKDGTETVGYVLSFRDLTEEKKFQREFIHSEKLAVVGQFAAATAHEIRNPLTSIKGFLQLLEYRLKSNSFDGEIRDYTRIMVEEVDRMEKIIRDFLLMTKPSDVVRENAGINSIIERMLIIVQNQATLRNIQVLTSLEKSLPDVPMHKEAIQQVILNLLQNAFEAMNTGGTLSISTQDEEREVAVRIEDSGVGMTEEEVANLGSPFYSTKMDGTGLGLTVSSKIIKEHNGRLSIESKKGVGTTVIVRLPKK